MRFLIFFSLIFLCVNAIISEKSVQEKWISFKSDFSKKYDTAFEEDHRYNIFQDNLRKIEKHNKKYESGKSTYFQGVTSFADKTFDEYLELVFKEGNYSWRGILNETDTANTISVKKSDQLKTTYELDWTQKGAVTEVKDQGKCGSCYAFAAIGALESANWKKNGKLVRLSEQNIIDCAADYGNFGCEGGMPYRAFNYIKDNNGVDTEESYPYEGAVGKCRFKSENVGAKILSHAFTDAGKENKMKSALETSGPLPIVLDAGYLSFQLYAGGVLFEPQCSKGYKINHALLAVGYGEQNGVKFWKIKNSFGKGWGDKGYFLIARDMDNHCGLGYYVSSVTSDEFSKSNIVFNKNIITFNLLLFTSLNIFISVFK